MDRGCWWLDLAPSCHLPWLDVVFTTIALAEIPLKSSSILSSAVATMENQGKWYFNLLFSLLLFRNFSCIFYRARVSSRVLEQNYRLQKIQSRLPKPFCPFCVASVYTLLDHFCTILRLGSKFLWLYLSWLWYALGSSSSLSVRTQGLRHRYVREILHLELEIDLQFLVRHQKIKSQ
jgi:hypothetical protein